MTGRIFTRCFFSYSFLWGYEKGERRTRDGYEERLKVGILKFRTAHMCSEDGEKYRNKGLLVNFGGKKEPFGGKKEPFFDAN